MSRFVVYKKEEQYPCIELKQKDGKIKPIVLPENAKKKNTYYEIGKDGRRYYFDGVLTRVYVARYKNFKTGETFEKKVPVDSENLILPENAALVTAIKSKTKDGKDFYHLNPMPVEVYEYTSTNKDGEVKKHIVDARELRNYNCLILCYDDGYVEKLPMAVKE